MPIFGTILYNDGGQQILFCPRADIGHFAPTTRKEFPLTALIVFISLLAYWMISAIQALMTIRAIASWFFPGEDSAFQRFLVVTTEPFIIPVRAILDRFEAIAALPIDISFLVTFILLSVLQSLL